MKRIALMLIPLAVASLANIAHATDRFVPDPFNQPQDAINVAVAGQDRVVIRQGGFYDGFVVNKAIEVTKTTPAEVTILPTYGGIAVLISAEGASVNGLTLLGGSLGVADVSAGEIRDCIVDDQGAAPNGRPVVKLGSSSIVKSGSIWNSHVISRTGVGIEIEEASPYSGATNIVNNTVEVYFSGTSYGYAAINDEYGSVMSDLQISGNEIIITGDFRAIDGIEIQYGGGTVTNNVVRGANIGIRGAASVEFNELEDCGTGIMSVTSANYNTIAQTIPEFCGGSVSKGIVNSGASNNLIYNTEIGIDCVTGTHNAYWADLCGTASTGCGGEITVLQPLFCYANEGTGKYTQKIDSAVAPNNNPWKQLVGAFGVECAWGTLARSSTVTENVTVLRDLTVPATRQLTLKPGTTLKFDDDDDSQSGSDHFKNELIISSGGVLSVQGVVDTSIGFISSKVSPGEGDWWGVQISSGGAATVDYADLENSDWGIKYLSASSGRIAHSSFAYNTIEDIAAGLSTGGTMNLSISNNSITIGGGKGIDLESGVNGVVVEDNQITGDAPPSYSYAGILIGSFISGQNPLISGNVIHSLASGYGIYSSSASPRIEQNDIQYCGTGIQIVGGAPSIGSAADPNSDNVVHGNWIGLRVTGGTPTVRNNQITDNNNTGALISDSGNPDLGTQEDPGKNTFTGYNPPYSRCINNLRTSQVSARGNYFGSCNPPTCTSGNLDTQDFLCTPPAGVEVAMTPVPSRVTLQGVEPNPMREAGRISYSLPEASDQVKVSVYDVAGRIVREFKELQGLVGKNEVQWDGRNELGSQVLTGIYFIRLSVNGRQAGAAKALVVR